MCLVLFLCMGVRVCFESVPASAACRLRAVPSLFAQRKAAKPQSDSSRHTWKGKDTKWKKQQIEFGISWSAAALIEGVKAEQRSLFLNSGDVF